MDRMDRIEAKRQAPILLIAVDSVAPCASRSAVRGAEEPSVAVCGLDEQGIGWSVAPSGQETMSVGENEKRRVEKRARSMEEEINRILPADGPDGPILSIE